MKNYLFIANDCVEIDLLVERLNELGIANINKTSTRCTGDVTIEQLASLSSLDAYCIYAENQIRRTL